MTPEEWLREAIRQVGGYSALAKELGLTKQAIAQWILAPAKHVMVIERLTGIHREDLRPDVFEPDFVTRDGSGSVVIGEVKYRASLTDEEVRKQTETNRPALPPPGARGYRVSEEIRSLVAELFDDELEQAKELLASGYKAAAAVVAGVVIETALRKLCGERGIPVGKLDKINADLAKAGVYDKVMHKRVTTLAKIRNKAAHGDTAGFNDADVRGMITDVERFVSDYLAA
jgi:DNA-binding transcriptional regulator YdaS (Cro superfamily)